MTQREKIIAAFRRGERIRCTDAYPMYGMSPHSYTRIVKELRDMGMPILDTETKPKSGGKPYKTYYLKKEPIKQVDEPCPKCGSYYRRGNVCNVCRGAT